MFGFEKTPYDVKVYEEKLKYEDYNGIPLSKFPGCDFAIYDNNNELIYSTDLDVNNIVDGNDFCGSIFGCCPIVADCLLVGGTRDLDAKMAHDGLRKTGAVCTVCQAGSAVNIWISDKLSRISCNFGTEC